MHTNLHMVDGIGRLCQASEEPSRIWTRSRSNEGVRFNAFANRSIVSSCAWKVLLLGEVSGDVGSESERTFQSEIAIRGNERWFPH